MKNSVTSLNTEITTNNIAKAVLHWCYQHHCRPDDFEYVWDEEQEAYMLPEFVPDIPMVQFLNCTKKIITQNWLDTSNQDCWSLDSSSEILNECIENTLKKYGINVQALTWTLSRSKMDKIRYIKIDTYLYDIWENKLLSDSDTNTYPKSEYLLAREKERYC